MHHLKIAQTLWQLYLKPGDTALDATAGTGQDTLFLAQTILTESSGALFAMDIQKDAIEKTETHLKSHLSPAIVERITLLHASHETLPSAPLFFKGIIYNLGYLPGGDKSITTMASTSLQSCQQALSRLLPGGFLSIMFYPGHNEGLSEQDLLLPWIFNLPKNKFQSSHYKQLNNNTSPHLIFIRN